MLPLLVLGAQILELGIKSIHPGLHVAEGGIMGVVSHLQCGIVVHLEHVQLRLLFPSGGRDSSRSCC